MHARSAQRTRGRQLKPKMQLQKCIVHSRRRGAVRPGCIPVDNYCFCTITGRIYLFRIRRKEKNRAIVENRFEI